MLLAIAVFLTVAGPALGREPARPRGEDKASRLSTAKEAARRRLIDLLAALWPTRAGALAGVATADADWAEADRRYVWTRAIIEAAGAARAATETTSAQAARGEAGQGPGASPGETDAVFSASLASRVRKLDKLGPAASPGEASQALDRALGAADFSDETSSGEGAGVFTPPAGGFSWPAEGKVVAAFAPSGRPPRQGVVLAVPTGSTVAAAADGRVVFSGALRGLGRMLILSHGQRRHTVYACLGQVDVAVDDVLARGAVLGRSGFCAPTRTSGVYFELRFREKALNPAEWLAARQ